MKNQMKGKTWPADWSYAPRQSHEAARGEAAGVGRVEGRGSAQEVERVCERGTNGVVREAGGTI